MNLADNAPHPAQGILRDVIQDFHLCALAIQLQHINKFHHAADIHDVFDGHRGRRMHPFAIWHGIQLIFCIRCIDPVHRCRATIAHMASDDIGTRLIPCTGIETHHIRITLGVEL